MKNKVILLAAVLTLGFSANAFAAAGTTAWLARAADGSVALPYSNSITPITVKPSANVFLAYGVETTGGAAYTLGTIHIAGTFTYATTSTDTNIYRFLNASNANATAGAPGLLAYTSGGILPPNSPTDANNVLAWAAGWSASK